MLASFESGNSKHIYDYLKVKKLKVKISKLFKIDPTIVTDGTNAEKGSGLGLILCKEFVEKLNGKIWVESKENIGSKFIFTVPLVRWLHFKVIGLFIIE